MVVGHRAVLDVGPPLVVLQSQVEPCLFPEGGGSRVHGLSEGGVRGWTEGREFVCARVRDGLVCGCFWD